MAISPLAPLQIFHFVSEGVAADDNDRNAIDDDDYDGNDDDESDLKI